MRLLTQSLLPIVLLAAACANEAAPVDGPTDDETFASEGDLGMGDGKADGLLPGDAKAVGETITLELDHAAFPSPDYPGAVVYIPHGFDPTPPLNVVVYLHGLENCASNVLRPTGTSCNPAARTPIRSAANIAAQMEASNKNAILLVPEVAFDVASSDPGALGEQDGFLNLLDEVIGKVPALAGLSLWDVDQVVVASHSGGYRAAAGIAVRGGLWVSEVYLLDSFYDAAPDYDAWVNEDLDGYLGSPSVRRFASVYTVGSGDTRKNSQEMAVRAATWYPAGTNNIVDDRTTSTWGAAQYAHGLLFKRTGLAHGDVPRYYFGRLVATSSLPDKPAAK